MQPNDAIAAHRPSREHVKLVIAREGWAVYLSPQAKIIDMAVIMNALPCTVRPVQTKVTQGFLLRPVCRSSPPPTLQEFDAIFLHGFDARALAVPYLLKRQAD